MLVMPENFSKVLFSRGRYLMIGPATANPYSWFHLYMNIYIFIYIGSKVGSGILFCDEETLRDALA